MNVYIRISYIYKITNKYVFTLKRIILVFGTEEGVARLGDLTRGEMPGTHSRKKDWISIYCFPPGTTTTTANQFVLERTKGEVQFQSAWSIHVVVELAGANTTGAGAEWERESSRLRFPKRQNKTGRASQATPAVLFLIRPQTTTTNRSLFFF